MFASNGSLFGHGFDDSPLVLLQLTCEQKPSPLYYLSRIIPISFDSGHAEARSSEREGSNRTGMERSQDAHCCQFAYVLKSTNDEDNVGLVRYCCGF